MEDSLFKQKFSRDINQLNEADRFLRTSGIKNLNDNLFADEDKLLDALQWFQQAVVKNLVKIYSDPIEKNRELSLQLTVKFLANIKVKSVDKSRIDKDIIVTILKVLVTRLNALPFPETSEEIRLQLIKLFELLLELFPEEFLVIIQEFANMLSKILQDPYAEIKKETAKLIMQVAKELKKDIGYHSQAIIKSLSLNLAHQHQKVRSITMEALGEIIMTDGAGPQLESIDTSLKHIVNDKIIEVRRISYQCLAKILNGLNISNLRAYESKLLYLLMNGFNNYLSDENQDVQNIVFELLEAVGSQRKQLAISMGEKVEEFIS